MMSTRQDSGVCFLRFLVPLLIMAGATTLVGQEVEPKATVQLGAAGKSISNPIVGFGDREVACGLEDGEIRLVSFADPANTRSLQGHRNLLYALEVLDNQRLLSSSGDMTLRVWDLKTATSQQRIPIPDPNEQFFQFSVHPDQRMVTVMTRERFTRYDLASGELKGACELEGRPHQLEQIDDVGVFAREQKNGWPKALFWEMKEARMATHRYFCLYGFDTCCLFRSHDLGLVRVVENIDKKQSTFFRVTPDGKWGLMTIGQELVVLDMRDGRIVKRTRLEQGRVVDAAFSKEMNGFFFLDHQANLHFHECKLHRSARLTGPLAAKPTCRIAVNGTAVIVLDAGTGTLAEYPFSDLAVEQRLAEVKVDPDHLVLHSVFDPSTNSGHLGMERIAFTPDDRFVALAMGSPPAVNYFSIESGICERLQKLPRIPSSLRLEYSMLSHPARWIAMGGVNQEMMLFDLEANRRVGWQPDRQGKPREPVAFSPGFQTLLSGHSSNGDSWLYTGLLDPGAGREQVLRDHPGMRLRTWTADNGKKSDQPMEFRDFEDDKAVLFEPATSRTVRVPLERFSRGDQKLLKQLRELRKPASAPTQVTGSPFHQPEQPFGATDTAAVKDDGSRIYFVEQRDNKIIVAQPRSGPVKKLNFHSAEVRQVILTVDQKWLLSSDRSGLIAIWDTAEDKVVRELDVFRNKPVADFAIATKAPLVAAINPELGKLRVYNHETGKLVHDLTIPVGSESHASGTIAMSSDGTVIAFRLNQHLHILRPAR